MQYSPTVASAIEYGQPLVALESTIIAHGMPYPQNVETALLVEATVREAGAIPATMAIIQGQPFAGLTTEQIEYLGKRGRQIPKVSRRDLAVITARGMDGATTVAATMILAHRAGIRIFATGGIGGVHRGVAQTFDISADLQELARTPVAVVCAGAKSILDLPKTLEYLETMGVPVLGYQTDEFPAFYSRESGLAVDYRIETAEEIAHILRNQEKLDLQNGVVVTHPIPSAYALPASQAEQWTQQAIAEANQRGLTGQERTPFLLKRIQELSEGKSLQANIQLVRHNAQLAARISRSLSER